MLFLMFCEYYKQPDRVGDNRRAIAMGPRPQGLSRDSMSLSLGFPAAFFVIFFIFFSAGEDRLRDGTAQSPGLPIVPAGRRCGSMGLSSRCARPLMIAGVIVYTLALRLFGGISVTLAKMLGYLPVIFFGAATPGPMHSVAILFCALLLPEWLRQMTAFDSFSTISLSCSTRRLACYFSAGRRGRSTRRAG